MFRTHDDSGGGHPARWEVPGGSLRRGSARGKTDPKNLWGQYAGYLTVRHGIDGP